MVKKTVLPEELINPSWANDLKLFINDLWFFLRDTINDGVHLVLRFLKLVTLISVWYKNLSVSVEFLLKSFRKLLKF